jgi:hypothetical protein
MKMKTSINRASSASGAWSFSIFTIPDGQA